MKKLTRTEANFENLLEAAILLEGHCRHAEHGCSCRGCDECEENYMAGQEEGEAELTLDELIDRELGPEVGDRYEYEGEDPYKDDIPDEENDELLNTFSQAMEIATKAPELGLLQRFNPLANKNRASKLAAAADKIAGATSDIADRFVSAAKGP